VTRNVVIAAAVLALGCAGVHRYHPNFYSLDGDIRLGQQLQKEVESEVTLLRLSALTQLVNSIGTRLQESSPNPAFMLFPYTFHFVDSP
jgi:predicted Zn-dependent protease